MRWIRTAGWVCLAGLSTAPSVAAQFTDASALPWGRVSISVGGRYLYRGAESDDRFTAVLGPSNVAPLRSLETDLNRFFQATDTAGGAAFRAAARDLGLGAIQPAYTADYSELVFRIEAGLTRRLSLHAAVPLGISDRIAGSLLTGTVLGVNPDTAANRRLLASLGADAARLGASPYLPTVGSRLGTELVSRVQALTGGTLRLPTSPVAEALVRDLFTAAGYPPPTAAAPQLTQGLRLADVELGGRFQFRGAGSDFEFPDSAGGRRWRGSIGVAVRLPTGVDRPADLLDTPGYAGEPAIEARLWNDVALSGRFWGTVAARAATGLPSDVRVLEPLGIPEFPNAVREVIVRREPGFRLGLEVSPRYQLTPALTLGAQYALAATAEDTYGSEVLPAQTAHAVGAGASFSTLPLRGLGIPRFEVSLSALRTVAGELDAGLVRVEARTIARAWGPR